MAKSPEEEAKEFRDNLRSQMFRNSFAVSRGSPSARRLQDSLSSTLGQSVNAGLQRRSNEQIARQQGFSRIAEVNAQNAPAVQRLKRRRTLENTAILQGASGLDVLQGRGAVGRSVLPQQPILEEPEDNEDEV